MNKYFSLSRAEIAESSVFSQITYARLKYGYNGDRGNITGMCLGYLLRIVSLADFRFSRELYNLNLESVSASLVARSVGFIDSTAFVRTAVC